MGIIKLTFLFEVLKMIQYIESTPTVNEFNALTDSVGWGCANI